PLGVQPGPPGANPFCPCGIERGAARGRKAVVLGDAARWQKSGGPSTTVAHGRKIARFLSGGVGPVRGCPMRNTDKTRTAVSAPRPTENRHLDLPEDPSVPPLEGPRAGPRNPHLVRELVRCGKPLVPLRQGRETAGPYWYLRFEEFDRLIRLLASHGQMAWDPHWDAAGHGSHTSRAGAREPRASAATRRVEGAPAAATADGNG